MGGAHRRRPRRRAAASAPRAAAARRNDGARRQRRRGAGWDRRRPDRRRGHRRAEGAAGNCSVAATDGGAGGGACGTTFNFESGVQGAVIDAGSIAFTNLESSGTFTFCGAGALAVTALFSGPAAPPPGRGADPLPSAPAGSDQQDDHRPCRRRSRLQRDLNLSMVVNTPVGSMYFSPPVPVRPRHEHVADGNRNGDRRCRLDDLRSRSACRSFSQMNYTGTISIDEIDIR